MHNTLLTDALLGKKWYKLVMFALSYLLSYYLNPVYSQFLSRGVKTEETRKLSQVSTRQRIWLISRQRHLCSSAYKVCLF